MSTKRCHDMDDPSEVANKKYKFDLGDEKRLSNFNEWMLNNGLHLNKVSVSKKDVCSGWGLIANSDIHSGEVIFTVPHLAYLAPENSEIGEVIQKANNELKSKSGWVPLLLTLMYEYTKEHSKWRPYFDMVPDIQFDIPMFWDEEEINNELQGTSLKDLISRDVTSLTEEYHSIVLPFVMKNKAFFDPLKISMELFKKMVAFVMAYSFTKPSITEDDDDSDDEEMTPNPPIMVPLADILNHISKNNAQLEFKKDFLNMVATRNIKQGEEIFNTYGELSNGQLLHMYGYAEEPSLAAYDTVDASASDLYNILLQDQTDKDLFNRKWNFLLKTGYIPVDGCFVLGPEGVLTEEQLLEVFKVIQMDEKEFSYLEDKDGWFSDEESDESLSIESILKLDHKLKKILHRWIQFLIGKYPRSLKDEETFIMAAGEVSNQSSNFKRKLFSAYVRCGQLRILEKFRECTK